MYHAMNQSPMRVYPPFGLPGENATRSVNASTLGAIRWELGTSKRQFVEVLAELQARPPADLSDFAERFWEEVFAPVDFFVRPMPCMFLMIDLKHMEPDRPPEIDYDHGVAPDGIEGFALDNRTLPRDDGDEIDEAVDMLDPHTLKQGDVCCRLCD